MTKAMTTAPTSKPPPAAGAAAAAAADDDDYQTRLLQAGDPLASVLHIFDRFNHRHRNQHRVAKWWVQFARLRRALRRLDHAILSHRRRLRTASLARPAPASPAARPRRVPSPLGPSESAVAAHARWLASRAVPPAYLAFTQLAADRQHAPLGLLLVALTARLDALLAPLNPTPTPPLPPQSQPPLPQRGAAAAAAATVPSLPASATSPAHHSDHFDLGEVVSRSEVRPDHGTDHDDDEDDGGASIPTPGGAQQTGPRITPSTSEPAPDTKSQSKPRPDAKARPEAKTRPEAKAKTRASKAPKKKKPKDDEFADLFSSLL